jgi:hypothetical protein
LDVAPYSVGTRPGIEEHPFGAIKAWMSSTHFLMKRLKNVHAERPN